MLLLVEEGIKLMNLQLYADACPWVVNVGLYNLQPTTVKYFDTPPFGQEPTVTVKGYVTKGPLNASEELENVFIMQRNIDLRIDKLELT